MRGREAQRSLKRRRHVGEQHAHVAPRYAPRGLELRKNPDSLVDRHGEPDIARPGTDGGVNPDHLAARVDQWTAAVAEIDGGVGLDVVVQARIEQLAADETDDAHGDRMHVPQRIPDGTDPLADPELVGVAERRLRQIRAAGDLQQRDVDGRIGPDDFGAESARRPRASPRSAPPRR